MTQTTSPVAASGKGKWKVYSAYKDSGVEWLGEVPEHWRVICVKYLSGNRMDIVQTGPFGAQLHASDYIIDEGVPLILIRNVNNLRIDASNIPKISLEKAYSLSMYCLEVGDIVFSRVGSLGRVALVTEREKGWLISGQMLRLRIHNANLDHYFAIFYFCSDVAMNFVDLESIGSTRESINTEILRNIPFLLPPLPEQRAITAFLDRETARINTLIAKKERLIELLQEKRAALISHAVTKGLDPEVKMKDSGVEWLGEIPAHWEVRRLKFVAEVLNGVAKGRDLGERDTIELPYLRVANVQDGYLDLSDIATIMVGIDEVDRYSLQFGDVLMNEGGDFDKLGRGYVWNGSITPCLHQNHVFAVRPHRGINPYWINIITLTSYAKHYFILKSKQSTNLASISGTNLKELPVLMPPDAECNAILEYIAYETTKIDALISRIRDGIEKLREYSIALISAAVTGKIDVATEHTQQ